mmetsp:Transcript_37328/g.70107  ORF Transcript_37328/g.70107 Transcript_37328/m.70107 type:complete len:749 (-) Transcript_37328:375-2621(-)
MESFWARTRCTYTPSMRYLLMAIVMILRCTFRIGAQDEEFTALTQQQEGLTSFFKKVDHNGDGQIQRQEVSKYLGGSIGGADFDTEKEITEGVERFISSVDSEDLGLAVSEQELESHLSRLMTASSVERWVVYGLRLKQYAEAFRRNAITALDLPLLVTTNALEEDLGVASALHRKQIQRAIKRMILGVCSPPGAATNLTCTPIAEGVSVAWANPQDKGHPPTHGYVLQRRSSPHRPWQDTFLDGELDVFADTTTHPGVTYTYRLMVWGACGESEAVMVGGCVPSEVASASSQEASLSGIGAIWLAWRGMMYTALCILGCLPLRNPRLARHMEHHVDRLWQHLQPFLNHWHLEGVLKHTNPNDSCVELHLPDAGSSCEDFALSGFTYQSDVEHRAPGAPSSDSPPCMPARGCGALDGSTKASVESLESLSAAGTSEKRSMARARSANSLPYRAPSESTIPAGAGHNLALQRGASSAKSGPPPERMAAKFHSVQALPDLLRLASQRSDGSDVSNDFAHLDNELTMSTPLEVESNDEGGRQLQGRRNRCSHEGCETRWDRWHKMGDIKMKFRAHFCKECQAVYCQKHTRISPHGVHGQCGLESACYCLECFNRQPPEIQAELEKTNKLIQPPAMEDAAGRARYRWQTAALGAKWSSLRRLPGLKKISSDTSCSPGSSADLSELAAELEYQALKEVGAGVDGRKEKDGDGGGKSVPGITHAKGSSGSRGPTSPSAALPPRPPTKSSKRWGW